MPDNFGDLFVDSEEKTIYNSDKSYHGYERHVVYKFGNPEFADLVKLLNNVYNEGRKSKLREIKRALDISVL